MAAEGSIEETSPGFMSIFRRDAIVPSPETTPQPQVSPQPVERPRRLTHVAVGSKISGLVSGGTEVLIDGEVEGELKLDHQVVVGPQGKILGNITARSVRISGRVVGNVQGFERVEVTSSGTLEGDVLAPRVIIAEGAFVKGRIAMKAERAKGTVKEEKSAVPDKQSHEGWNPTGG